MRDFARAVSVGRSKLVPDGAYRRMVELQHGANVLTEEAEVAAVK